MTASLSFLLMKLHSSNKLTILSWARPFTLTASKAVRERVLPQRWQKLLAAD